MAGEDRLLTACVISLPPLAIRLTFSVVAVFDPTSKFSSIQPAPTASVVAQALMVILEEFVIVAIFLYAGFTVAMVSEDQARPGMFVQRKLEAQ